MSEDFFSAVDFRRMLQGDTLGGDPVSGFTPLGGLLAPPTDRFTEWARENDAPTGQAAQDANASAQQATTTAEAKPCATCDKNGQYSLAFRVTDTKDDGETCSAGSICAGMYYTIKMEQSGLVYQGTTDENGLTERYFTSSSTETVYLYLGHRSEDDGYPTSQDTDENKIDEAPLFNAPVAAIAEQKIVDALTKRQWKPWKASKKYKGVLNKSESPEPNQYPSPEGGNDTIGIGHKITDAEIASKRFTEGEWAQPLSDEKMEQLRDEDIAKNGGNEIERRVFVPLYYYEVDAMLDLSFNGGPGALKSDASSLYDENGNKNPPKTQVQNLSKLVNADRYSLVPNYLKNHFNTSNKVWSAGVQNRRDMDARMFANEENGYTFLATHSSKKKK
ncbi:hypothetical protein [Rhizobium sp. CNPSo 4039]|uniref:glycoside hydrolase family protein n=1 Tax=Rhizobium sp. CNPSo 4039 TaxID=3021409 RepID=UPI00254E0EC9|nr:hypothetical protein [Rhizobium sp. CNPSo 4039]MDK4715924.1 hypothetical protein [Rhizobium sp. CNPSo 4039]